MDEIIVTAHQYFGCARPWVARVTGMDSQYGFARAFLAAATTSSRSGATGDHEWSLTEPGLYECRFPRRRHDDGGMRIVWRAKDGALKWTSTSAERAREIARLMDAGETFAAARLATRPAGAATSAVAS